MNYVYRIENWAENHQVKWLAALRIILGLIIFLKGLFFIMNTDALLTMISNSAFDLYAVLLVHLVASAHLLGGILIMLGLIPVSQYFFKYLFWPERYFLSILKPDFLVCNLNWFYLFLFSFCFYCFWFLGQADFQ